MYYSPITGRDRRDFPEYHDRHRLGGQRHVYQCVGPITYVGQALVQADIANLSTAMEGLNVEQAYLPAVAPGSIEHWLKTGYYPSEEAFLYAIADAMHQEYRIAVSAPASATRGSAGPNSRRASRAHGSPARSYGHEL